MILFDKNNHIYEKKMYRLIIVSLEKESNPKCEVDFD